MSKGTLGGPPVVAWFRQGLRLQDHAALQAALAGGQAMPPERFVRAPWSAPPTARRAA